MLLFCFLSVRNILRSNPPIAAPHIELITGEDVIGQLPLLQPTNRQYRKPATPPVNIPIVVSKLFFVNNLNLFIAVIALFCNYAAKI